MKDMIAAIASMIFMGATLGLMLHVGKLVLAGGSLVWIAAWVPFMVIGALGMAITGSTMTLTEKKNG